MKGTGAKAPSHTHAWVGEEPWRVCADCMLVQRKSAGRWRTAPEHIQTLVRAAVEIRPHTITGRCTWGQ